MRRFGLEGLRIMVVEDELLIAMMVESALIEQGCQVVGPFARVPEALKAARHEPLNAALLDINLNGDRIYPVADALAERGVPFLLVSGYGQDVLPSERQHWPVLTKPFRMSQVLADLSALIIR